MKPLKPITIGDIRADLEELVKLLPNLVQSQHILQTEQCYLAMLEQADDFILDRRTVEAINHIAERFNLQLDI